MLQQPMLLRPMLLHQMDASEASGGRLLRSNLICPDRHRMRQTDRQTERETDRLTLASNALASDALAYDCSCIRFGIGNFPELGCWCSGFVGQREVGGVESTGGWCRTCSKRVWRGGGGGVLMPGACGERGGVMVSAPRTRYPCFLPPGPLLGG